MAFNPFRAFRRHQKVLFAGLTILCMLTFVLTGSMSGARDFFQAFLPGSDPRRGTEIATLYGKPVYEQELRQLALRRQIANQFMMDAMVTANFNLATFVSDRLKTSSLEKQEQGFISQVLNERLSPIAVYYRDQWLEQLESIRKARAAQKPEDAVLVQQAEECLQQAGWLAQRKPGDLYFGGGVTDPKDLLDFLIWEHQAERLGINLADSDLDALASRETQGALRGPDWTRIFEYQSQRYRGLDRDSVRRALINEFRVRLAQEAVLGVEPRDRQAGFLAPATPYQFWTFYRDNRTESDYVLLETPVGSPEYLAKAGTPTEAELRTFFDAHKDREADPASPEAGFKQPARIMVEWVSAKADSPQYKDAARVAVAALQATLPLAYEARLSQVYEYEKYKYSNPSWLDYNIQWTDQNLNRAENVVALLGALAAPVDPSAALSAVAFASARDYRDRAPHVGTLVLTAAPGLPLNMLAPAYAGTPRSAYQPADRIRDKLVDKLREEVAQDLAQSGLNSVQTLLSSSSRTKSEDVRKFLNGTSALGQSLASGVSAETGLYAPLAAGAFQAAAELSAGERDALEILAASAVSPWAGAAVLYRQDNIGIALVRKEVAELIERLGLDHGQTTRPRDRFDIGHDPGLTPLKEAYASRGGDRDRQFASVFFPGGGANRPLYVAQSLGTTDRYLYWPTAEEPPYVPEFADVRAQVEARWKLEKARVPARQAADQLAAEARKAKGDAEKNLLDAAKRGGRLIRLDHVARLVPRRQAVISRAAPGRDYGPYEPPTSDVEYPSANFTNDLLAMKEMGDVAVLSDRPEAHYYVATLVHRSPPYELAFYADAAQPEALLTAYEEQTHADRDYREGAMEQLRQEAKLTLNEENIKKWRRPSGEEG